jgi:F0F1-type ATP synthase assembly protein I
MFANVTSNVNYENLNTLRLAASVETCHLETKWILLLDFIIGIILGGGGGWLLETI